jgi:hypothetical protein
MLRNSIFICVVLFALVSLTECEKESNEPQIELVSGSGLFFSDTIADPGQHFSIRIKGNAGSAPATNFRIIVEANGTIGTVLDSGIYADDFDIVKSFYFGGSDLEKWSFYIKNKNGDVVSSSIAIRRNPNALYGPIIEYPNLVFKMQSNSGGNMAMLKNGTLISAPSSVNYQSDVDFLAYYSTVNFYTLSSPNETEAPGFYPSILSMTTKNEVRYKDDFTTISTAAYDAVLSDSLILAAYDNSVIGKRKAKNVVAGNVVPFVVQTGPMAGKKGMVKIIDAQGESSGTITLSIKIQHN